MVAEALVVVVEAFELEATGFAILVVTLVGAMEVDVTGIALAIYVEDTKIYEFQVVAIYLAIVAAGSYLS